MSVYIPLDKLVMKDNIRSDPDEDLGELMESIKDRGQLEPCLVSPIGDGTYLVQFGHRRVKALRMLGMDRARCEVRSGINGRDRIFIQIEENAQRKNLSPEEWVRLFDKLRTADPSMTDAKISLAAGKSHGWAYWQRRYAEARARIAQTGLVSEADLLAMTDTQLAKEARNLTIVKGPKGKAARDSELTTSAPALLVFRKGQRSITIVCRDTKIRLQVEAAVAAVKRQKDAEETRPSKGKTA